MSRMKKIADSCTISLERGQRARWEAAARRKGADAPEDLADWIVPILDAAADYERAMGRSAAELLRLMIPVPLRPLLRTPGRSANGSVTEILVPTVGAGSRATRAKATMKRAVTVALVAPRVAEAAAVKPPAASATASEPAATPATPVDTAHPAEPPPAGS